MISTELVAPRAMTSTYMTYYKIIKALKPMRVKYATYATYQAGRQTQQPSSLVSTIIRKKELQRNIHILKFKSTRSYISNHFIYACLHRALCYYLYLICLNESMVYFCKYLSYIINDTLTNIFLQTHIYKILQSCNKMFLVEII